jgi:A/G-specific adenine glycosylase
MSSFAQRVIAWQREHGRRDLPWQGTRDPYRIWLAEIMLQQTQVATVIPYYLRFLATFPDVRALAAADEDAVLAQWSGLGYYRRARFLHAAARTVLADHRGVFPRDAATLATLPGIGRSTAAAIAAFASNERGAILDGNVKRVLARHRGIDGDPTSPAVETKLWAAAQRSLPHDAIDVYTQGMMDLGATLCMRANPRCEACPVRRDCVARRAGRVDELPSPRARRALPHRELMVLLVERAGEVLLERRPATGVWPRLWSLPEAGVDEDPVAIARKRYGVATTSASRLDAVEHGFTHYTLTLHPARLSARTSKRELPPECLWVPRGDLARAALPAPIRKLLAAT